MRVVSTVRRVVLTGFGALAGVAAYAFLIEPRWLEVTRTRVPIDGLPAGLEGLCIALVTDLHAGGGTSLALVRRACRLAMQEHPDLIALTGDFVSAQSDVSEAEAVDVLALLHAPLGVYAVPGNHDHAKGIASWRKAVQAHPNIIDLTNEIRTLDHQGAAIGLTGVDDLSTGGVAMEVLQKRDTTDVRILLAHNPDTAELLPNVGAQVDLVLSGHTHGGQVRVPFWGALVNPAHFDALYEEGLVRRPWAWVYTSRGIGTVHYPVRFLCRPEVAVLELVRA